MLYFRLPFLVMVLFLSSTWAALSFTEQPSIQFDASTHLWNIRFAVSDSTDVEVTVLKASDASIVRRLVAGKLGALSPAPLTTNSLIQHITWDGRNEMGVRVDSSLALAVRVRAGMSVALAGVSPDNPYFYGTIYGMAVADDGSIVVQGLHEYGMHSRMRQYDKYGQYQRTLFPFPAGLDAGNSGAWNVISANGSGYCPDYNGNFPGTSLASLKYMSDISNYRIMPFTSSGSLVLCDKSTFNFMTVNPSNLAKVESQTKLLTYPTLAPNGGPFLFTRSPQPGTVALSGVYNFVNGYDGTYIYPLDNTTFWRDGSIYRLVLQTGVTSLWHTIIPIDSIPAMGSTERNSTIGSAYSQPGNFTQKNYAAIHGLAFDDSGRVYVCDRFHKRVAVYDTATWTLQGSISVSFPHLVEFNKTTGEVFVMTWTVSAINGNVMHIYKYPGFRNNPASTGHFQMVPPAQYNYTVMPTTMASNEDGNRTLLYVGAGSAFLILRDSGSVFTKIKDFDSLSKDEQNYLTPVMYERLAVDKKTETVYSGNGWCDLYKILDWSSFKAVRCSTSSNQPLYAAEAAISLDGSYLLAREATIANHASGYAGPIKKYAIGPRLTPANFKSSNQVHDNFSGKYGAWFADKGFAISRQGNVAISDGFDDMDNVIQITDADSTFHDSVVYPIGELGRGARFGLTPPRPFNSGGVKYDFDGNLYVGSSKRASDNVIPTGYGSNSFYLKGVGAVYKFSPAGGSVYTDSVRGALKVYAQGLGAFSGNEAGGSCRCRSPRFDLDPYGRLFIPNGFLSQVIVADNNGNDILKFGEYGNVDSKGAGSLVPGPAIPLATPQCVAVSDNYIYIADWNNTRIARVKMNFDLDNRPEMAVSGALFHDKSRHLQLAAFPNPFNPFVTLTVSLPEGGARSLEIAVYDLSGRRMADYRPAAKSGQVSVVWNGCDRNGQKAASGVYLVKVAAGEYTRTYSVILSK